MRVDSLPLPLLGGEPDRERSVDCADGLLTLADIARVAGVTPKQAKRAVQAHLAAGTDDSSAAPFGAVFQVDDLPDEPGRMTRADVARRIGVKLGIGRFGVMQRVEARAAARPQPPQEDPLTAHSHPWRLGTGGRAIRAVERGHQVATLTCACGTQKHIRFREVAAADQIDQKFRRAGWLLDPSKCQTCAHPPRKENAVSVAATPSPAAIKSQATMFRLIDAHFDVEAGRYAEGWSDEKIGKDTGLSVQTIAAFRDEAFGKIKEPPEVAALAADIATFDQMLVEAAATVETMKGQQRELRVQLTALRKKFGA